MTALETKKQNIIDNLRAELIKVKDDYKKFIEDGTEDALISVRVRKTNIEADILDHKKLIMHQRLVDPKLAINQIQIDYSRVKDRIITMKMQLLKQVHGKNETELELIFNKSITKTLNQLSTMDVMENKLVHENTTPVMYGRV